MSADAEGVAGAALAAELKGGFALGVEEGGVGVGFEDEAFDEELCVEAGGEVEGGGRVVVVCGGGEGEVGRERVGLEVGEEGGELRAPDEGLELGCVQEGGFFFLAEFFGGGFGRCGGFSLCGEGLLGGEGGGTFGREGFFIYFKDFDAS